MFGEQILEACGTSPKEFLIIGLVAEGLKKREIARSIGTTEQVVKNYLRDIYDKLGFSNRVELALWYERTSQQPSRTELATARGSNPAASQPRV